MYSGQTLTLNMIDNDFAELNFNNLSGSVNKFDQQTLAELETAVSMLTRGASIKGLLVSSSKSVFVVGADITEFSAMFAAPKEEFIAGAQHVNGLFSAIEDLPYPSVAAINGFALGGGLEVCLACDSRVMNTRSAIGLPETGLGIIPGWGGTVRLPRLVGFAIAAQWISSGVQQAAQAALESGAVDQLAEPEDVRNAALALLTSHVNGERDFEQRRVHKRSALNISSDEITQISDKLQGNILGRTGTKYPAPLKVIDLLSTAILVDRDSAVHLENQAFYEVCHTPEARALVGLFLGAQFVVKQAKVRSVPFKDETQSITSAAVIGAGIMGGGIAYQNALKGYSVVMKDIAQPALDLGMREASKLLNKGVQRGKLTEVKSAQIISQIQPTLDDNAISDSNMIVEAVVELESVKTKVLAAVEAQLSNPESIITSNTSTISITSLGESLQRPENFCGMHFFNPVHAMPLVEIIRGEKTSDKTIAAVCAYTLSLGKKPIVVNDCPGFLVNRVLFATMFGMEMLIAEGADFQQIDHALETWGLPMGPAYLSDVVGLDTIVHCYSVMLAGIPERFIEISPARPSAMLVDANRLGQKNGLGYYGYQNDERGRAAKAPDPAVIQSFEEQFGTARPFDEQEIVTRVLLPMGMEMARCLEEGIVASPTEADMALIYGLGFPSFRGGICRWMDEIGLAEICALGDQYSHISPLYKPTDRMRDMAANGETFY